MAELSYPEIIQQLEARGIMPERAPSLDLITAALQRVIPSSAFRPERTIVVAGTNGKGSVCATLEALLLSAGQRVGFYSSPHLVDTTERIRINGRDISRDRFREVFSFLEKKVSDLPLSHFEFLTLMAAWIFFSPLSQVELDWIILEVGLGGLWDTTNAVPHHWCVITSLGLDHQNLLGNTLPEIAFNKFGIVQPGSQVIHTSLEALGPEVLELKVQTEKDTQSQWTPILPFQFEVRPTETGPLFILETPWGKTPLPLPGRRGAENSTLALTVFEALGYSARDHLHALQRVSWPGRMEKLTPSPALCPVFLSGDHNPAGIQSLLELLPFYPRKHLYLLVGIGKEKDAEGILSPLIPLTDSSLFLTVPPFRGRSRSDYGAWVAQAKGFYADPDQALKELSALARPEDMILVTGSLYLVGAIKAMRFS